MADASTIIKTLGQQVAQLVVDKAIVEAELAEARGRIGELEAQVAIGTPVVEVGEAEEG